MRPVLIPRCVGVEKPMKKPGQTTPGLEPGTSRVQSGALGAWPRCSVPDEQEMICFKCNRDCSKLKISCCFPLSSWSLPSNALTTVLSISEYLPIRSSDSIVLTHIIITCCPLKSRHFSWGIFKR
jgi:hypothetical protein